MSTQKDFLLTPDWDLDLDSGDLQWAEDGECVAQLWKLTMLWIRGEWFYNISLGMPWFEETFKISASPVTKRAWIANETTRVPGVRSLQKIEQTTSGRGASLELWIDTVYNTQQVVTI